MIIAIFQEYHYGVLDYFFNHYVWTSCKRLPNCIQNDWYLIFLHSEAPRFCHQQTGGLFYLDMLKYIVNAIALLPSWVQKSFAAEPVARNTNSLRRSHFNFIHIWVTWLSHHTVTAFSNNWWAIRLSTNPPVVLTTLPLDKMAAILQKIFSDTFSWIKIFEFDNNFTELVQLTITQHSLDLNRRQTIIWTFCSSISSGFLKDVCINVLWQRYGKTTSYQSVTDRFPSPGFSNAEVWCVLHR